MKHLAEEIRSRVNKELLKKQINFLVSVQISNEEAGGDGYREGILNLMEWIYDLGWPPGTEKEDALRKRANRAAKALVRYPGYEEIRWDLPDAAAHIDCAVDLVADLLHLAKMKWGADPDYVLRAGKDHFEAEQRQEA